MSERTSRRGWPLDILAVVVVTVGLLAVTLSPQAGFVGSPLQVILGLSFVFFAPGGAVTAALFPRGHRDDATMSGTALDRVLTRDETITTMERLVLALGLSVAVVPLIALLLNFTAAGVQPNTVLPVLAGATLALSAIGLVRRFTLPAEDRYGISLRTAFTGLTAWIESPASGRDQIINLVLVIGLILAVTGVAYAVVAPQPGERFTEFYLRTSDPETGQLVADDYPSELAEGEQMTLYLGLTNQEHQTVSYTVVAELQRVDSRNQPAQVISTREIDRFSATVDHEGSWQQDHVFTPTMYGDSIRLTYMLYKGEPPAAPSVDTAYRSVHIWLEIG
jgi:uncharacterized membrane protein